MKDLETFASNTTNRDVEKEIFKRIVAVGYNEGWILGTTHNVQNDTSVEKIEFFFSYRREVGKYPIKDNLERI
jgi:uroporphyrinogen-III decarboxylase